MLSFSCRPREYPTLMIRPKQCSQPSDNRIYDCEFQRFTFSVTHRYIQKPTVSTKKRPNKNTLFRCGKNVKKNHLYTIPMWILGLKTACKKPKTPVFTLFLLKITELCRFCIESFPHFLSNTKTLSTLVNTLQRSCGKVYFCIFLLYIIKSQQTGASVRAAPLPSADFFNFLLSLV